jgi:hypothetical protein
MMLMSATSNIELPQVIPSSSQSQIFERYINHEISEYNGLPDITIPLYEIEIKGLKIPIALTYHASDIQYMQHDGEVGVGWSINAAGYRISRSIKGRCDFSSTFYDYDNLQSFAGESDKTNMDRYLEAMYNRSGNSYYGTVDGEYDLFNYTTPSTYGHFILTDRNFSYQTCTATTFVQKMDKLSMYRYSGQLIDENGFQYFFGNQNSTIFPGIVERSDLSESLGSANTAWPLRTIQSPYGDSVCFDYNLYSYTTIRDRKDSNAHYHKTKYTGISVSDASSPEFSPSCEALQRQYDMHGNHNWYIEVSEDFFCFSTTSPYLTRIKSSKEEIEFLRITRNGRLNSPTLINEIKIYGITNSQEKILREK